MIVRCCKLLLIAAVTTMPAEGFMALNPLNAPVRWGGIGTGDWRENSFTSSKSLVHEQQRGRPRAVQRPVMAVTSIAAKSFIRPAVVAASTKAVAELLSCVSLGVLAARKGILTPQTVTALSQVVYNIFLPSLLMTSVAKTVAGGQLSVLLPIPIMAVLQIGIGLIIARGTCFALKIDQKSPLGREVKACSAFGNSGILPLLFCSALFRNHPDPTILPRAVSFISFYLMGWSPAFWTLGFKTVTGSLTMGGKDKKKDQATDVSSNEEIEVQVTSQTFPRGRRGAIVAAFSRRKPSQIAQNFLKNPLVTRILSPPIVACFLGLAIGTVSPLRSLFLANGAPLGSLWAAFVVLAGAYVPTGVLVLAGSLANGPPKFTLDGDDGKKIAAVGTARWILMPISTAILLASGIRCRVLPTDPLFSFIIMMESVMPSAQNSVIMLQIADLAEQASKLARTLCLLYVIGIIPVSILLTAFLEAFHLVA